MSLQNKKLTNYFKRAIKLCPKTIIPQLDRCSICISFAQTFWGKLLLLGLFGLGLRLCGFEQFFILSILLAPISFSPKNYLPLILIINICFWIYAGNIFQFHRAYVSYNLFDRILESSETFYPYLVLTKIFIIISTFGLISLNMLVVKYFFKKSKSILPWLFLIGSLILTVEYLKSYSFDLYIFGFGVIIVFSKVFWYFLYSLKDFNFTNKKSWLVHFSTFSPFWIYDSVCTVPMPRGYLEIESSFQKENDKFAISQIKGLKIIYWSALLKFIGSGINNLVFNHYWDIFSIKMPGLGLPNYFVTELSIYNQLDLPIYYKWLAALAHSSSFILSTLAAGSGMIIGILRMAGILVPRHVYRPLEASSFHDFFRKIYFYYNHFLTKFFIFPLWKKLFFLKSYKKTRKFLSIFLAITVGGGLEHYLRYRFRFVYPGLTDSFIYSLKELPYFMGLGLFSGISSILFKEPKFRPKIGVVQLCKVFIFLILLTLCFALKANAYNDSWEERWMFFLSLFGKRIIH